MTLWTVVGVVVALIFVVVIGYVVVHETPRKLYKKARGYHRDGEEAYEEGDVELAEEYYTKANEYRKRARELE